MISRNHREDLSKLSDEELVDRFRAAKTEAGGGDPGLTPPDGLDDPIRIEMQRRGLAPDREDVIPHHESTSESPVEDDA